MKIIIMTASLLFSLFALQSKPPYDYKGAWATVDKHTNEGLPQSAIAKVEEILATATSENNQVQTIKSHIYLCRLYIQNNETGVDQSIKKLAALVATSSAPVKQIGSSYLAELYFQYYQNNQYVVSQRSTQSVPDYTTAIESWDNQMFIIKINELYASSIADEKALDIPVDQYIDIINEHDTNARILKPSIYELLTDRALVFFTNTYISLPQNTESFDIKDPDYLGNVATFLATKSISSDKSSNKYLSINAYQHILNKLKNNASLPALASYDLERINYIHQNSSISNREQLYKARLESMLEDYKSVDYQTEIYHQLATHVRHQIGTDSMAHVKALSYCERAIKAYPKSTGALKCQNLINEIKKPEISISAEHVYPTQQHLLQLITYNNVAKATVRIVSITDDKIDSPWSYREPGEIFSKLKTLKDIYTENIVLAPSKTLKGQTKEIDIPNLPIGKYATIVSAGNIEQFTIFHISDIGYTSYNVGAERHFFVTDRKSGKPLPKASIKLYKQEYDYNTQLNKYTFESSLTTDKNGHATKSLGSNNNYTAVIHYSKDVLDLRSNHGFYNNEYDRTQKFSEVYTDRSIYRPGQTVYFKALLFSADNKSIPSLQPNQKTVVSLLDANYQLVSKLELTTNEFGSCHGSFVLPTGKMNGAFSINCTADNGTNGGRSIQVEEYKRPTFTVVIDPLKSTPKLNDKISIMGKVATLAGTNINEAKVKYTVTRNVNYPYWDLTWRYPMPSAISMIITQGETLTDADGNFTVNFDAIPDPSTDRKQQPIFTYNVDVSVVDGRGETRSATQSVSVGYTAYNHSHNWIQKYDIAELPALIISSANHNGEKISASGTFKIEKLTEPAKVLISKYWDEPGHPLTMGTQKMYFPQYIPTKMPDYSTWTVEKELHNGSWKSGESIDVKSKLKGGVYKITSISKDASGAEIKYVSYTQLTDFSKNIFPKTAHLLTKLSKASYQPGEKAAISFGASQQAIYVHIVVSKDGKVLVDKTQKVDKKYTLDVPITENHRGGVQVMVMYFVDNRYYAENIQIDVPWTNKELNVEFISFRDKLLPGEFEKYSIKISGKQKDKVIAEVMSSMYDASLDELYKEWNQWRKEFYPNDYNQVYAETPGYEMVSGMYYNYGNEGYIDVPELRYPSLIPLMGDQVYYNGGVRTRNMSKSQMMDAPLAESSMDAVSVQAPTATSAQSQKTSNKENSDITDTKKIQSSLPSPRTNLKETVFFFPDLKTDAEGNITISFTMNDALTRWKLRTFAHTTDLRVGYDERFVQTQKNIMVFPNAPRFVRDGDELYLTSSVANMSDSKQSGQITLQLVDPLSGKEVTKFLALEPQQAFDLDKGQTKSVSWKVNIPESQYGALTYRISASAGGHTDAEENTIPVITNRIIITETMPMWIGGEETKTFKFDAFKNQASPSHKDLSYTIEYTSHPIWYAIQALPYMASSGQESTNALMEQVFTNLLARKIVTDNPGIKTVFDLWKGKDSDALLSNLNKNTELKSVLLQETPWVMDAQSEEKQKQNIALLFDINNLRQQVESNLSKLSQRQMTSGGFAWFTGGREDEYTTQEVVSQLGHLQHLGVINTSDASIEPIVTKAQSFLDKAMADRYKKLQESIKMYKGNLFDDHLDDLSVHYLYLKSFYPTWKVNDINREAINYYTEQIKKYWLKRSLMSQSMIGLTLHRSKDKPTVDAIMKSLRERATTNVELGMYWNEGNGFYWYQLPIERQSIMIELFSEVGAKQNELAQMQIWLLKNKQTNRWKTNKATISAINALLINQGKSSTTNWLAEKMPPSITIGSQSIVNTDAQAGTGYVKRTYAPPAINKSLGDITITNPNKNIAWGAAYYQYSENIDKVKAFADTPLKLKKQYFKVITTSTGEKIETLTPSSKLKPGDVVKVRVELTVDRAMEYIHMKDQRPSGFEPLNVVSSHKYQGGLSYYETTKDVATHFYFQYLPKGSYVFEYPMVVVHRGDFTGGVTHIESMYAPEFGSHSEGSRIKVEGN